MRIKYLLPLFFCSTSFAYTLLPNGVMVTVEYDEPTQTESSTTLKNLQKTLILYSFGTGQTTLKEVPATKLTGGGHIVQDVLIPILPGEKKTATLWSVAVSTNSRFSQNSNIEKLIVDRSTATATPASGTTSAQVSGTEFVVTYKEPTKNTDGSPLNDLLKTVVIYDVGKGPVIAKEVAATSINGGGNVSQKILIPVTESTEIAVSIYWVAYDISLNPSPNSIPVVKRLDRLAPAGPQ